VTKAELRAAVDAVRSYFEELHQKAPETFKAQGLMLKDFEFTETDNPPESTSAATVA
jgi:tRNA U38,U39,U40 pseudouridine synthase TruA